MATLYDIMDPTDPGQVQDTGSFGTNSNDWSAFDAMVTGWYQQLLGRAPSLSELNAHRGNPGGPQGVYQTIATSPEAQDYDITKNTKPPDDTRPNDLGPTAPTAFDLGWLNTFMGGVPATPSALIAKEADLLKLGVKVLRNSAGVAGKIQLPDGSVIDVIGNAAGGGGGDWQWLTGEGEDTPDTTIPSIDPSYLAPWTESFTPPADAAQPELPTWPTFEGAGEFKAPSAEDIYADPSFQFRLNEGRGVLENSAAAKGVLNSGGTLADILNYGQKAASQEYGNIWNRDFSKWQQDWANLLNKWTANTGAGQDVSNRATSRSNTAYDRAWAQYGANRDAFYANQSNPFNKLYSLSTLGLSAAGA